MKILHIGDVHLGCNLEKFPRNQELARVFGHLVEVVRREGIEGALFAGDIFDTGAPSNESQELYYGFLVDLQGAGCRQVVIIAGNHDNPNFLEAPKGLLKRMNIHVVGKVIPEEPGQEVVALGDAEEPAAYVCAVPYLRSRDVRLVREGESGEEQEQKLTEAITAHYRKIYALADSLRGGRKIPIIGMGHLYAHGSVFGTADAHQTVGNLDAVPLEDFADGFDYLALGHIHKAQIVGGHDNWRYAGSLLRMTLQEQMPVPQVILLDTENMAHPRALPLPEECFQTMQVIRGDMPELRKRLQELQDAGHPVWVKPVYTGEEVLPNWSIDLRQELRDSGIQIVLPETQRRGGRLESSDEKGQEEPSFARMTPEQVFLDYLARPGEVTCETQRQELLELFRGAQAKVCDASGQREETGQRNTGVMRFKRLFLKNINSLYGENLIDFEAPAFNGGIFLISGSTGAGKSSILDAICLALFAWTPRVGRITASEDSVMGEGANEMCAELTFSIGPDVYRASFQHTRTRRAQKPFGQPEHRLYQDDREIASGRKAYDTLVSLVGMNEEQFTRCVLLAQGSFDAFLKSKAEERSAILRNITGTEIYSRIGAELNQEYNAVKEDYTLALKSLGEIECLSPEALEALQASFEEAGRQAQEWEARWKECTDREEVFRALEVRQAELDVAQADLEKAQSETEGAATQRAELEAANRALHCQEQCSAWQSKEREVTVCRQELEALEQSRPGLAETLQSARQLQSMRQENLGRLLEHQAREAKLFQEVRLLDAGIAELAQQKASAEQEWKEAASSWKSLVAKNEKTEKLWQRQQAEARAAKEYLTEHPKDAMLAQKRDAWELRRGLLVNLEAELETGRRALRQTENTWKQHRQEYSRWEKKCAATEADLDTLAKNQRRTQAALKDWLDGRTRQEIQLAWAAAGKLNDFFQGETTRREFLVAGEACPLCGSKHHPYCDDGVIPEAHDYGKTLEQLATRLASIDACQTALNEGEKERGKLAARQEAELAKRDAVAKQMENDAAQMSSQAEELKKKQSRVEAESLALAAELRDFLGMEWQDHGTLPKELDMRIAAYTAASGRIEALTVQERNYLTESSAFQAVARRNEAEVKAKAHALEVLKEKIAAQKAVRFAKFGREMVEVREKSLAADVAGAREALQASAAAEIQAKAALGHNQEEQDARRQRLDTLDLEARTLKNVFLEQLHSFGFEEMEDFQARRRTPRQVQDLTQFLQALEVKEKEAQSALAERRRILLETQARLLDGLERSANLEALEAARLALEEARRRVTDLEVRLLSDKEAHTRQENARRLLEGKKILFNNWKYLNDNFGSTGTKDRFGHIAQGYTFRELLRFANANRLASLQRHFTLVSDAEAPLELNVIDHYRGDIVRTSRNLSGGECFEVSLALALGLADMSAMSQNARLGNVLLDEGFGTLDDKALDSALELLMQLKNEDRKLVGIISHVAKLLDKIEAQIHVTSSAGMGSLEGAGVAPRKYAKMAWDGKHQQTKRKKQQAETPVL